MKLSYLCLAATLLAGPAHATKEVGNGGDACEERILSVRDDLAGWIKKGGAQNLALPAKLTLARYEQTMKQAMARAVVSCTAAPVIVRGVEKTCTNFARNGRAEIVCNYDRFLASAEDEQYRIVHHEYAGVAGLEENREEESDYTLSRQLTKFLEAQTVKRLSVMPVTPAALLARNFGAYYAKYRVLDCTWRHQFAKEHPDATSGICPYREIEIKTLALPNGQPRAMLVGSKPSDDKLAPDYYLVVGNPTCELAPGKSRCEPGRPGHDANYATSTVMEKKGSFTFLTLNWENLGQGEFQQWTLVLENL